MHRLQHNHGFTSAPDTFYASAKNARGFTLIEVLTVIIIISILIGIVYVSFEGAREEARNKALFSSLRETQLAIELFKAQNGHYPVALNSDCGSGYPSEVGDPGDYDKKLSEFSGCGENYIPGLVPQYLDELPTPEMSGNSNCLMRYYHTEDGSSYKLVARRCLEGIENAAGGIQPTDEFARYPVSCSDVTGYETSSNLFYETPAIYGGWRYCIDLSDNVADY